MKVLYAIFALMLIGMFSDCVQGISQADRRYCGNRALDIREEMEEMFGHPGASYTDLVDACLEGR